MRFLLYLIVCAVALWLGDMFFYHGRYRNELWRDAARDWALGAHYS